MSNKQYQRYALLQNSIESNKRNKTLQLLGQLTRKKKKGVQQAQRRHRCKLFHFGLALLGPLYLQQLLFPVMVLGATILSSSNASDNEALKEIVVILVDCRAEEHSNHEENYKSTTKKQQQYERSLLENGEKQNDCGMNSLLPCRSISQAITMFKSNTVTEYSSSFAVIEGEIRIAPGSYCSSGDNTNDIAGFRSQFMRIRVIGQQGENDDRSVIDCGCSDNDAKLDNDDDDDDEYYTEDDVNDEGENGSANGDGNAIRRRAFRMSSNGIYSIQNLVIQNCGCEDKHKTINIDVLAQESKEQEEKYPINFTDNFQRSKIDKDSVQNKVADLMTDGLGGSILISILPSQRSTNDHSYNDNSSNNYSTNDDEISIYERNSEVSITNVQFKNNVALWVGGAIGIVTSSSDFCISNDNCSGSTGDKTSSRHQVIVSESSFINNYAGFGGGAIQYVHVPSSLFSMKPPLPFFNHSTSNHNDDLYDNKGDKDDSDNNKHNSPKNDANEDIPDSQLSNSPLFVVQNCEFYDNTADYYGGAISLSGIESSANSFYLDNGGMFHKSNTTTEDNATNNFFLNRATIDQCHFENNSAFSAGGAIHSSLSISTLPKAAAALALLSDDDDSNDDNNNDDNHTKMPWKKRFPFIDKDDDENNDDEHNGNADKDQSYHHYSNRHTESITRSKMVIHDKITSSTFQSNHAGRGGAIHYYHHHHHQSDTTIRRHKYISTSVTHVSLTKSDFQENIATSLTQPHHGNDDTDMKNDDEDNDSNCLTCKIYNNVKECFCSKQNREEEGEEGSGIFHDSKSVLNGSPNYSSAGGAICTSGDTSMEIDVCSFEDNIAWDKSPTEHDDDDVDETETTFSSFGARGGAIAFFHTHSISSSNSHQNQNIPSNSPSHDFKTTRRASSTVTTSATTSLQGNEKEGGESAKLQISNSLFRNNTADSSFFEYSSNGMRSSHGGALFITVIGSDGQKAKKKTNIKFGDKFKKKKKASNDDDEEGEEGDNEGEDISDEEGNHKLFLFTLAHVHNSTFESNHAIGDIGIHHKGGAIAAHAPSLHSRTASPTAPSEIPQQQPQTHYYHFELSVTNTEMMANAAAGSGGAIYADGEGMELSLNSTNLRSNAAISMGGNGGSGSYGNSAASAGALVVGAKGGALSVWKIASATLQHVHFWDNYASPMVTNRNSNNAFDEYSDMVSDGTTKPRMIQISGEGGAFYAESVLSMTIQSSTFEKNRCISGFGGNDSGSKGGGVSIINVPIISSSSNKSGNSVHSNDDTDNNMHLFWNVSFVSNVATGTGQYCGGNNCAGGIPAYSLLDPWDNGSGQGGALYIAEAGPVTYFRDCSFVSNSATAGNGARPAMGGAVAVERSYNVHKELVFDSCEFSDNYVGSVTTADSKVNSNGGAAGYGIYTMQMQTGRGGAIFLVSSKIVLSNCVVKHNMAKELIYSKSTMPSLGGGIFVDYNSKAEFRSTVFDGNMAGTRNGFGNDVCSFELAKTHGSADQHYNNYDAYYDDSNNNDNEQNNINKSPVLSFNNCTWLQTENKFNDNTYFYETNNNNDENLNPEIMSSSSILSIGGTVQFSSCSFSNSNIQTLVVLAGAHSSISQGFVGGGGGALQIVVASAELHVVGGDIYDVASNSRGDDSKSGLKIYAQDAFLSIANHDDTADAAPAQLAGLSIDSNCDLKLLTNVVVNGDAVISDSRVRSSGSKGISSILEVKGKLITSDGILADRYDTPSSTIASHSKLTTTVSQDLPIMEKQTNNNMNNNPSIITLENIELKISGVCEMTGTSFHLSPYSTIRITKYGTMTLRAPTTVVVHKASSFDNNNQSNSSTATYDSTNNNNKDGSSSSVMPGTALLNDGTLAQGSDGVLYIENGIYRQSSTGVLLVNLTTPSQWGGPIWHINTSDNTRAFSMIDGTVKVNFDETASIDEHSKWIIATIMSDPKQRQQNTQNNNMINNIGSLSPSAANIVSPKGIHMFASRMAFNGGWNISLRLTDIGGIACEVIPQYLASSSETDSQCHACVASSKSGCLWEMKNSMCVNRTSSSSTTVATLGENGGSTIVPDNKRTAGVSLQDNCCLHSCHDRGECRIQSNGKSTCVCSWFYEESTHCGSFSSNGLLFLTTSISMILIISLSSAYYRMRRSRHRAVRSTLDELRLELLGGDQLLSISDGCNDAGCKNNESDDNNQEKKKRKESARSPRLGKNLSHSYIHDIQQQLFLKDVSVPLEELQFSEENVIGDGAFGVVYQGTWRGSSVAIKMIRRNVLLGMGEEELSNFKREAFIMSRLRHPNIALLMGISISDSSHSSLLCERTKKIHEERHLDESLLPPTVESLFIITEYMKMGSLADVISNVRKQRDGVYDFTTRFHKKISWNYELILSCALQAAQGMMYLHSNHPPICHRDLKASNLLVDENWVVKVADFGVSRIMPSTDHIRHIPELLDKEEQDVILSVDDNLIQMTSNMGTVAYAAPEMLVKESQASYGLKVDVYSFGMVLYELFELKEPFANFKSRFDIIDAIRTGRRPEISSLSCPKGYRTLIDQCVAQDPKSRPAFSEIVIKLKDELTQEKRSQTFDLLVEAPSSIPTEAGKMYDADPLFEDT